MKPIEYSSELLRERYFQMTHRSGLAVYVFPKKLNGIYALLSTGFGSIDTHFLKGDQKEEIVVPDGIAHFLEHKLFENEDGSDSLSRFSALGADANAYTSYNKTAYLFSCTDHFEESLEELLRFVTHPHFTQKTVEKEIGIISEEIRMTEDNPWDRGFQLLLQAMYREHPVRNNICGSQESIRQITPKDLYACHECFYNLSQMVLVVCGDVTCEQVIAVADRVLPDRADPILVSRCGWNEPKEAFRPRLDAYMQVSKPIFFIGFKDSFFDPAPDRRIRRDAAMTLLGEILFSRSGNFYNGLFESGVLSPSFSVGYSLAEGFAFYCISGESDTPEDVVDAVMREVERVKQEGISDEEMERCRRVLYSDEVRAYDSTEEIANRLLSFVLDGAEMLSYPELIGQIAKEELVELLETVFQREYLSVTVIYPLEQR